MNTALSVVVDLTLITFVFALAALGLAIVFGLMGVINMGHGAMLTLGHTSPGSRRRRAFPSLCRLCSPRSALA